MTDALRLGTLAERAGATGLFPSRVIGRALIVTTAVRTVTGLVFLTSAIPKITAHQEETRIFDTVGLPPSTILVYLVAALEIGCGLLLLVGPLTRLAG